MAESEEELKTLLISVKEESEKATLKLSIQETKIMTSGPITSWHIDREKNGNSDKLYFLGLKVTVDSDFSHDACSLEEKLVKT